VVHGDDGVVATVLPDGTGRTELASAEPGVSRAQATWSPDGKRIAYVEAGSAGPRLVVAAADGSERSSGDVPAELYYLSWSPDGERIVGLGSPSPGTVSVVVVGIEGLDVQIVDSAAPYYLVWAPDAQSLLANRGGEQIGVLSPDGAFATLDSRPGVFRAPDWEADRRVWARTGSVRQSLIVDDDGELRDVLDYQGLVAFDVAGDRVAYLVLGEDEFRSASAGVPLPAPPGVLAVLDVESGAQTIVTRRPVFSFEWSPDGTRLLFLALTDGGGAPSWNVWDGEAVEVFDPVLPSLLYQQAYLPFFDQYSRSQTAWAPDSSAFAFAGTLEGGRVGAWVQGLDGTAPVFLGPGDMVSWSPAG